MNALLTKIFGRFFSTAHMIKPDARLGDIPSTREAYKTVSALAIPAIAESVLISLVSIIDTIMVSSLGDNAIAAVGYCTQPRFIALAIFFSLTTTVTAVVSRRKGEQRRQGANDCLSEVLFVAILLGIIISILCQVFGEKLVRFAGAGDDTIVDSLTYFRIVLGGLLFNVITMVICAAQRGSGNTRITMITNVTANLVNVCFNYLLIGGNLGFPALGVKGAAIATVLGYVVGTVIALYSVSKPDHFLYVSLKSRFIPDRETISAIVRIGGATAIEQVFMRVGFFTYSKIVANLGTIPFATHNVCMNLMHLSFGFGDGLSQTAAALTGQNLGKKRPDLSSMYVKCAIRIGTVILIIVAITFMTFGGVFVGLFSETPEVRALGSSVMRVTAFIVPGQILQVIFSGSLRGAGDTRFIAAMSLVSIAILRPITSYILCYPLGLGLVGAWLGFFIDQTVRMSFSYLRFKSGKWVHVRV